jgi:uncharacterized repeat protein (TIGR03803 family)
VIFDSEGNAYGTATGGGAGYGTIYELTPSQSGWTANILYSFDNITGSRPSGPLLLDNSGSLFGTTSGGGNMGGICKGSGCGTVFELHRLNGGWQIEVLYTFSGGLDGAHPSAGLVLDGSGNLFGTTPYAGGSSASGTVFELSPSNGTWQLSILHTFTGSDGAGPSAGLTAGAKDVFYGTTGTGGLHNLGTVYQLTKKNSGWKESVLYSFSGNDGSGPGADSLLSRQGKLYGTTSLGGAFNQGTVFSLSLSNHAVVESVLYSFTGTNGVSPNGGVVSDAAGRLYGTTVYGGTVGYGVIFEVSDVAGKWQESVLTTFAGITNGAASLATPTINHGALFGTTSGGGEWDAGVVWEITPN